MEKSVGMTDLFDTIKEQMDLKEIDIVSYSPLTLAYIGDAVYELVVRTMIVDEANRSVNKLHTKSSRLVKASSQAAMVKIIMDCLTENELAVYKRGRNAKSFSKAKNATVIDYRMATGFEALMGYLYLTKASERMCELIKIGLEGLNNNEIQ